MTYLQGVVLGLVQGLTEFLPVSSSGHLILVPHVFGWADQGLGVDAALHLGTLAALVVYFRHELAALGSGALSPRLTVVVVVATVPGALAGALLGELIEGTLRSASVIASSAAAWAIVMWLADRRAGPAPVGPGDPLGRVSWRVGLTVGCAQALALIPGTSRSGITISAGLFGGLDRSTAARFSFLLGIPITAGAGSLKLLHLLRDGLPAADGGPLVAALLSAFLSGWLAVWFLVSYLKTRSLAPFVIYRLALAVVILAVASR